MEANASRPHVIYQHKFLQAFEPLPPQDLLSRQQRNVQLLHAIDVAIIGIRISSV